MIIKGNSRGGASQLARHLLRPDTNEIVTIIQLDHPDHDLQEAFRDWQLLSTGTKGNKGLYHSNLNPDHYDMTREQWLRSVEVLEKELGFTGQPRAIVLHQKKDKEGIDREHIHIVWQRTNIDTMTLKTDSNNYMAHERASMALEQEFGHEMVPGKHAKRDRQKQPDFPRAETSHEEWQQAERSKIDPRAFKEKITALYHQCDTGQALKNALAENGYILATGDKRGFVIVDEQGEVYSLSRQLLDVKAKDMKELLKEIGQLPNVEQAKALQEAERILKQQQPAPAPPQPEPDKSTSTQPHKLTPEQIAAIEEPLKKRHAQEGQTLDRQHDKERKSVSEAHDDELKERLAKHRADQKAELDPIYSTAEEYSDSWMKRFIQILIHRWEPSAAERDRIERERKIEEIKTRHRIARETTIETLKMEKEEALNDLKALHDRQRQQHAAKYQTELTRYIAEEEQAQKLIRQMEEEKRKQELNRKPDEPDPPKPSL